MKVKLPVTQYQEVDIRLPLQKKITEHLIKCVCGYNDMYLRGNFLMKTDDGGRGNDERFHTELVVREATEEDEFIFRLLADISKFNGENK